jgi:UDP-2,4-diacetamido-2,4,6-trideoxy-beta-L-altropyranose hydrolase
MNVFIRVDSSTLLGAGHVMRCLALAHDLSKTGAHVSFICRQLPGNLISTIKGQGFHVWQLEPDQDDATQTYSYIKNATSPDWLVVDHYHLDHHWERKVRPLVKKILVIDDLANRAHDCDRLLDQNLYPDPGNRYKGLVSSEACLWLGPKYLLLRDEFQQIRPRTREASLKRILISFGGTDPTNETLKALQALAELKLSFHVDVVVGSAHPAIGKMKEICARQSSFRVHEQIDYLATLMNEADVAIGAGGTSTWERCLLGLPTITVEVADNQTEILTHLDQLGAIVHTGKSMDVDREVIAREVKSLLDHPEKLLQMNKSCLTIMKEYQPGLVAKEMRRML